MQLFFGVEGKICMLLLCFNYESYLVLLTFEVQHPLVSWGDLDGNIFVELKQQSTGYTEQ